MSTILEVAERAGVSAMTVSRYFNKPELLAPATRQRVQRAVEALGYLPNAAARSLVRRRTELVALVLPDIGNPFCTTLARGAEDLALEHGVTLMFGNSDEDPAKEQRYLDVFARQRVDGLLLAPAPSADPQSVQALRQRDTPVVLVDRSRPGLELDLVRGDNEGGGRMLVEHLHDCGYRHITFIGGWQELSTAEQRARGYSEAMRARGLEARVIHGRFDRGSGEQIVAELLRAEAIGDAIIAANNIVAVGAHAALRAAGLRVPDDVALAGFDEPDPDGAVDPFLTVVAQPAYRLGQEAFARLAERIAGDRSPPREDVLPVELRVRGSTRRR